MYFKSIREILNGREFLAISPDMTLEIASDLMTANRTTAAPVLLDGELVGLLSEHDLLRHVSQRGGFATATVAEVMIRQVVSIETRSSIVDAFALMQASGCRRLPVIDLGGKVVGLLSADDIPLEHKSMCTSYLEWRCTMAAA